MTLATLRKILVYRDEYEPKLARYGYDIENEWFGSVDAEVLWGMLRVLRPTKMIEVGSGESTRVATRALAQNSADGFDCRFIAIDPKPRVRLPISVMHITDNVEIVEREIFAELRSRDVLFIDTSHVFQPGNDVDCLYNEILPLLSRGVIVHCHDIFLPDEYPWKKDRGYNEQAIVQGLLDGGGWSVLWSSHQMQKAHPKRLAEAFSSYTPGRYPGSLWMRKR